MDTFTANQVFNPTDTIAEFLEKLDKAFRDPNLVEKAITEFQGMKQGAQTADEFFSQFDVLRHRAGLTDAAHDPMLIHQLKAALNRRVVEGVMRSATIPTTYAGWRTAAISADHTERQLTHLENQRRGAPLIPKPPFPLARAPARPQAQTPVPQQAPAPPAPHAHPRNPQVPVNPQNLRDFQGVNPGTHGGMGVPMDWSINNVKHS